MAEKKFKYDFSNRDGMLEKLRAYATSSDDDSCYFKEKIKQELLHCPELLYALHDTNLESELFDEDGNLNIDENGDPLGEWDRYFGDTGSIRPYIFVPETQDHVRSYVCYQVKFSEVPKFNTIEKYGLIKFTIYVRGSDGIDADTGIPRHDLIASIIREKFNWSNVFGIQCHLIDRSEGITDTNYISHTLTFQTTNLNSIVKTIGGKTQVINRGVRT